MTFPSRGAAPRLALLVLLAALALALALAEPADRARLMQWGEAMSSRPWVIPALILLQAVLFAFAMPGSVIFWLIAPFFAPVPATFILLAGSVTGALCAYRVAGWASETVRERLQDRSAFKLLARRSDFVTQCALRILPGFPHAVLNYGGGVLGLPVASFLLAATLGLAVKWGTYATAVHALVRAGAADAALGPRTFLPLVLLALLLIAGSVVAGRMRLSAGSRP